jgi:aminopeptidase N
MSRDSAALTSGPASIRVSVHQRIKMFSKTTRILPTLLFLASGATAWPQTNDIAQAVRLPTTVKPSHYDILIVPAADARTFHGMARIDIDVLQPVQTIVLNALELQFTSVLLESQAAAPQNGPPPARSPSKIDIEPNDETASFTFAEPVAPGRYRLIIDYDGIVNSTAQGLFALAYDGVHGRDQMLITQFEATDARRFMPCWDEPALKATFTLSVVAPADRTVVSNTPVDEIAEAGPGLKRVRFQQTPKMSTYLLFLGIGDFERIETSVGETEISVLTKRGDVEKARFALQAAAALLRYYNDYFAVPYPLPKLDLIAAPGVGEFGFHAMENWGAILYFEDALLVDPAFSSEADRQLIFTYIAHEMAHQWFGNLVTMAWWDDLWLNEGFANWMENEATDHFHPDWQMWLQNEAARQTVMQQDALSSTHAVVQPVLNPRQIAFDNITYDKGAAIIRMIENYVGEQAFQKGVRSYIAKYAYGNSTTDDLVAELQKAAAKPISRVLASFTHNPGLPSVEAAVAPCRQNRAVLSLRTKRLVLDEAAAGLAAWDIPVVWSAAAGGSEHTTPVAGERRSQMAAPCGAIKINFGQGGYFRSEYAFQAWLSLQQHFASLLPIDQLGLINDAWAMVEAGRAPPARYFDLIQGVSTAGDPALWHGVIQTLLDIDGLYIGLAERHVFQGYARMLLRPVFARVGWAKKPGEADNVSLVREDLVKALGQFGDQDVLEEARRRFEQYLQDPATLSGSILQPVLQVVAQHADQTTYDKIEALAKATQDSFAKKLFYAALATTDDPALATRTLNIALSDEPQSAATGLSMIKQVAVNNPDLAWRFAMTHTAELSNRFSAEQRYQFIPALAVRLTSPSGLAELRNFIDRNIQPDARREGEKAYAQLRFRIEVRTQHLPEISHWLIGYMQRLSSGAHGHGD